MRRSRKVLAFGAFGAGSAGVATVLALAVTTPATEGCYTHLCDQSNLTIGVAQDGGVVGTGEVVQRDDQTLTWESVPQVPTDGTTWTFYSGNETITFVYGPDAGIPENATVLGVWSWVAAQADAQVNFTNTSGQLAEYSNATATSVTVYNDACAQYYLRVVVMFVLPDAGAGQSGSLSPGLVPTGDAGTTGDASATGDAAATDASDAAQSD
jgi:hypothetical protein